MIEKEFKHFDQQLGVLVRFMLPSNFLADSIHIVGDLNGWDRSSHPLWRDREGRWIRTELLQLGCIYQFRYLVDRKQWLNDNGADAFIHTPSGISNSVVITDPLFADYERKILEQQGLRSGFGPLLGEEQFIPFLEYRTCAVESAGLAVLAGRGNC